MSLLGIRVTPELHQQINEILAQKNMSLQEWLMKAVRRELKDAQRKR